ncbi:hypothetical protein BST63_01845 [Bradyrhizobium canariense]|uniref:Uncharacterized protein n=1 Tax=Bradyrhizobium canariense TaxID=255045 RepID=A0A1X3G6R5_9BRAD|nr:MULTISPECIES: hypothetical protein [Bradyrhizobium]OSI76519.1 hypothetical protein BSZ21_04060 [Bradyrhizobium canariense]OSI78935.1 hypothetical protein BSZ22_02335 [Bradyrhizobium canariense]OSI82303.1 hypothetical protein BSZ23_02340 [Bradyrhizobium canariense]OSI96542.1 hypothetical protein BSZ25_01990 [Bradyrhizobium canariense]OSI97849.1 hypothetical protein BSZ24_02030 [Bradyrhizobium canariense]
MTQVTRLNVEQDEAFTFSRRVALSKESVKMLAQIWRWCQPQSIRHWFGQRRTLRKAELP